MIDPSIVLGIKPPPVIDPVDQYAKIQGVRNMISQQQLRQQQAQMDQAKFEHEQQQNAEADRASAAQKKLGELIAANSTQDAQGNTQTNHQAVIQGLAAAGHGKEAVAYDTQRRADEGAAINNQKTQIENAQKQLGIVSNGLQSLANTPDEGLPAAFDQKVGELAQMGMLKPGQIPPSQQILQQGGVPALRQYVQQHANQATEADKQATAHRADLEFSLNVNKFQQEVLKEAPKTKKEWTDLAAQLLGSAKDQQQWDAGLKNLATGGANGSAPLDVVSQFGAMYSPDAAAHASQLGMTAEQKTTEAGRATTATETARHNAATETEARQRIGIEAKNADIKSKEFDATFGAGANPALVGVEPKLRTPAMKDAQKAADEFQTATKAADSMQSMIDLARSGNKAAGSNLPLVGVETLNALNGIKRINKTEVDQYQGAGSLLDRIQGKIGKLVVGQPIPKDVMDDIEQMHKTLRDNSTKAYNDKLSGINQNYRSNFQPVKVSPVTSNADSGGPKKIGSKAEYDALAKGAKYIDSDGQTYTKK